MANNNISLIIYTMIQIEPTILPFNQGTATQMSLTFRNFQTTDTTCVVHYQILAEDKTVLSTGDYALTEEQYAEWSTDNAFVEQCVVAHLGLTIIEDLDTETHD
jgi:hypothetical protein